MQLIRSLALAFSMLSRLPVGVREVRGGDWLWVGVFFPLCGAVLGMLALAPYWLLSSLDGLGVEVSHPGAHLLGAFFYVAALAWLTRFFHLDGFCDVCDAGAAMVSSPAERLRIMKDCHVGAVGAASTSLLLLGKFLAAYTLASGIPSFAGKIIVFAAIPAAARFAMLALAYIGRYPRADGTAAALVGRVPHLALALAALSMWPLASVLPYGLGGLVLTTAILVAGFWWLKARRLFGGVTGDVLGACCETAEFASMLAIAAALFRAG